MTAIDLFEPSNRAGAEAARAVEASFSAAIQTITQDTRLPALERVRRVALLGTAMSRIGEAAKEAQRACDEYERVAREQLQIVDEAMNPTTEGKDA